MADINLDDPGSYARLDPFGMLRRVDDLAGQIETAWNAAGQVEIPTDYKDVANVVITGMGGSAIGGSLLEGYAAPDCPAPVTVWRGYSLPSYVGSRTLVIAVSYSGNTEETLSALKAARAAGARLLAVSTGGEVSALAREWQTPLIAFTYEAQPRAALGFLFIPLLHVFDELGFIPPQSPAVSEAIEIVRLASQEWGAASPESGNQAKQLARRILGRVAVVYGAGFIGAVARRWKTQLNENAKNWAFYEEFPELDHNAIVGYEFPRSLPDHVRVVILNSTLLPSRIGTRIEVTRRLLDEFDVPWQQVDGRGSGRLAHMMSLICLGDYVSYYLALLNGTDPTTIRPIDMLKEALARSG
jgi:glucose/mannose-6-phosphate isomerase